MGRVEQPGGHRLGRGLENFEQIGGGAGGLQVKKFEQVQACHPSCELNDSQTRQKTLPSRTTLRALKFC